MAPTNRPCRRPLRRGAMAVWCAILIPVVLMLGIFAAELGYMHLVRVELRTATDAAAHAGGRMLSLSQDPNAAVEAARAGARANQVAGRNMELATADIELGRCSERQTTGRWIFDPGARPPNALRVTGRRTPGSPAGPVPLLFAGVFDRTTFEPVMSAVSVQVDRDIVIVQDRSGSMLWPVNERTDGRGDPAGWQPGSPPPRNARWYDSMRALQVFREELDRTPTTEQVGLVSFATDSGRDCDLTTNYDAVAVEVVEMTQNYAGGATHIDKGLVEAETALFDRGKDRPLAEKVIVVMTDGIYNGSMTRQHCVDLAAKARSRGAVVHAITFSDEADVDLMRGIAAAGGGQHWHASNAAALADAYRTIARTVTTMLVD